MKKARADLHIHTSASDGYLAPSEVAGKVAELAKTTREEIIQNSELGILLVRAEQNQDIKEIERLEKRINRCIDIAKRIRTVAKIDHDTFLGTEEFCSEMKKKCPDKRVVVGTEVTTLFELPNVGEYAIHALLYFFDEKGFDMAERSLDEQQKVFGSLLKDYYDIISQTARSNNYRYIHCLREACNNHFFEGRDVLTEELIVECAKKRIKRSIAADSRITDSNQVMIVNQTDIAQLLSERGIGDNPDEIVRTYFRRTGHLYTPYTRNQYSVSLFDLLSEIGKASSESDLKAKRGIAHPSTYVRVIAKRIAEERRITGFYGWLEAEKQASEIFRDIVSQMVEKGLIEFIEAEYPRYTMNPPEAGDSSAFQMFLAYLKDEEDFSRRQREFWRETAGTLGIKISGGSDCHLTKGNPYLGYGFGDLDFADSMVDDLFSE